MTMEALTVEAVAVATKAMKMGVVTKAAEDTMMAEDATKEEVAAAGVTSHRYIVKRISASAKREV